MGTIFLVNVYYICVGHYVKLTAYAELRGPPECSKSFLGGKDCPVTPVLLIRLLGRAAFSMTKKKRSLRNENLKQTELQRLKHIGKKG